MKASLTVLFAALLVTANAASGTEIDLRKITCKEAVALPQDTLDLVSVWIDGFLSDDEDEESMIVDFSETDTGEIKTFCQKHPDTKLLQAVENLEQETSQGE